MTWTGYRDPTRRRDAANGAGPPPLPLTDREAFEQAKQLRTLGVNFHSIGVVMGRYHGAWASGATWRERIQRSARRSRTERR